MSTPGHPWIARFSDVDTRLARLHAQLQRDVAHLAAVQRWLVLLLAIETLGVLTLALTLLWTLAVG